MNSRTLRSKTTAILVCLAAFLALSLSVSAQPSKNLLRNDNRFANSPGLKEYPNANGLFLEDDITFTVNADGSTSYREKDAIKVLNKAGLALYSTAIRFYNANDTEIKIHSAHTITPEGQVIEVPADKIKRETILDNCKPYDYSRFLLIEFPQVTDGAIIEYDLETIHSPRADKKWWAGTYMQNIDPMLGSSFKVITPLDTPIKYGVHNKISPKFSTNKTQDRVEYTWVNGPSLPIAEQASMPDDDKYFGCIFVSNFAGWDELAHWYSEIWQKSQKFEKNDKLALTCARITSTTAAPEKRVNDICAYIAADYAVREILPDYYNAANPEELIGCRSLSVNDCAVLLGAMLKRVGLEVSPIQTTSRSIEDLRTLTATPEAFDHLILKVRLGADSFVWIDPAAPGAVLQAPPAGYQGTAIIQIPADGNGNARAYKAPDSPSSTNLRSARMEAAIEPSGSAEMSMQLSLNGIAAATYYSAIKEMANLSPSDRNSIGSWLIQQINSEFSLKATSYGHFFPETAEVNKPISLSSQVMFANMATFNRKQGLFTVYPAIYRSEMLAPLLTEGERQYPIRIDYPSTDEVRMHCKLPAGAEIVELPKNISVETPAGSFYCETRGKGNEFWHYSRLILNKTWTEAQDVDQFLQLAKAQKAAARSAVRYRQPIKAAEKSVENKDAKTDTQQKDPDNPIDIPGDL